jgi:hypothetical protein
MSARTLTFHVVPLLAIMVRWPTAQQGPTHPQMAADSGKIPGGQPAKNPCNAHFNSGYARGL